ncbi:MAG TPA: hypothetical protein PL019_02275 [Caldisericia bacterium]|nr:hypothetical protein [Caldisericia bacterium]HPI83485.1 hypothetical protein [Caldisericia bacterium]
MAMTFLLAVIMLLPGFTGVSAKDCESGRLFLYPSSFTASKGQIVTFPVIYVNNTEYELPESQLVFTSGADLEIVSVTPSVEFDGNGVRFNVPVLQPNDRFKAAVKVKVVTKETRIGYPMVVRCSATHIKTGCTSSNSSVVFLWAPTDYPSIEAQMIEVSRREGKIDFELHVKGGYPPYEYKVVWGDGGQTNTGGMRYEGMVELQRKYQKPGEYSMRCWVTDSLGKQTRIEKRIFLLPW